jgi:hypothetical protein
LWKSWDVIWQALRGNSLSTDPKIIKTNLAHGHSSRGARQELLVEPGGPALGVADQQRFKRAFAIARHLDREPPVIGRDRLAARAIAMIGDVLGLRAARRIAEMVGQLAAERPLDDRFLEAAERPPRALPASAAPAAQIDRESRVEPTPAALQTVVLSFAKA